MFMFLFPLCCSQDVINPQLGKLIAYMFGITFLGEGEKRKGEKGTSLLPLYPHECAVLCMLLRLAGAARLSRRLWPVTLS